MARQIGNVHSYAGVDCDDENPMIVRGSQICVSPDVVGICVGGGSEKVVRTEVLDGSPMTCIQQPNGLGVCIPPNLASSVVPPVAERSYSSP